MLAFVLTALTFSQGAPSLDTFRAQYDAARIAYDVNAAQALRDQLKALPADNEPRALRLHVDAALLVAELHRIAWEQLPDSNIAQRRPLGEKIDEAAEDGLAVLDKLPKDSEFYRTRADLLGVMIRSDFRAKKYRKEMETCAVKAVELDAKNPKAYVSQAKPFVFAKENEGGDPAKAIELLNKALELDPASEPARSLRGLAYKEQGKPDLARADWQAVIDKNPKCTPAADELKKLTQK